MASKSTTAVLKENDFTVPNLALNGPPVANTIQFLYFMPIPSTFANRSQSLLT